MEYYRGLIALRKQLPGLCDKSEDAASRIYGVKKENGIVSYLCDNRAAGADTRWASLMVVYNSTEKPERVSLPEAAGRSCAMHRAVRSGWILRQRETVSVRRLRASLYSDASEMRPERWRLEGEKQYEWGIRKTGLEDI